MSVVQMTSSWNLSNIWKSENAILSPHSGFALEQLALELLLFSLLPADQSVFIGMIREITVIYVHLCSIPAFWRATSIAASLIMICSSQCNTDCVNRLIPTQNLCFFFRILSLRLADFYLAKLRNSWNTTIQPCWWVMLCVYRIYSIIILLIIYIYKYNIIYIRIDSKMCTHLSHGFTQHMIRTNTDF